FQASDFPGGLASATRAQIRDAINRRQTKLIASIATNALVLTSTGSVAKLRNDWTSLQVTANNATLGFTAAGSPTFGTPVTPAATGATLDRVDEFKVGDAVRVTDGTNTGLTKITTVNPLTRSVTWSPNVTGIAGWALLQIRVRRVEFDLTLASGGTQT